MKKIILATNNEHKVQEIKDILEDMNVKIFSLKEMGVDIEVEEDGHTFIENARKKAEAIYEVLKHKEKDFLVLADDSGLMVDYLNGEPGVYSARYAGEHGNTKKNNEKLLKALEGVSFENRRAKFVCAIAIIKDNGEFLAVEEEAGGYIAEKYEGAAGFGYDPLFFVPEYGKTFAEMSSKEKNHISHRGKALKKLKIEMQNLI